MITDTAGRPCSPGSLPPRSPRVVTGSRYRERITVVRPPGWCAAGLRAARPRRSYAPGGVTRPPFVRQAEVPTLPASRPQHPSSQRPRPAPGRRRRPRWGLRLSAVAAAGVLLTGGVGHAMVSTIDTGVERVDPFHDLSNRPDTSKGLNFLLIGNDSREGITAEEKKKFRIGGEACHCADTIILVHLSEDRERASVVSLPRDSYAELPAHTFEAGGGERHPAHPDKMNAALSHGGPSLMVRTVEKMTGVRIDHYLEVNFLSFMRGVDEIGGVDVCTVRPLKDEKSGLDLPPGTSTLSGGEALQYVRARSVDPSADFGRMQRQQKFLAAFLDKAVSTDVLLNPAKLRRTADVMLESVRVDPEFGVDQMLELSRALGGFDASSAELTSVPVDGSGKKLPGGGSTVAWDEEGAERLFAAIREDRPLAGADVTDAASDGEAREEDAAASEDGAPDRDRDAADGPRGAVPVELAPEEVRVRVENASTTAGLAARADEQLAATGFTTAGLTAEDDPGSAATSQSRTTITHGPERRAEAAALRAPLPDAQLREVADHGDELLVAVGEDFDRVQPVRDGRRPMSSQEWKDGGFGAATGDQIICD
ncbi:LCP family protein [Streptomyces bohaiensis]|uniref:LCP family protein n=1 Tax=Streptomyces bohaiensis TaxID=1431344 RepID=A0ABX1CGX6_9ACTN|nr:LCP family protein [Streptomyces bohaiensis]